MPLPGVCVNFARETVGDCIDEAYPLLRRHFEELGVFKDRPLEPEISTYLAACQLGRFKAFTAREEGKLVGYAGFWVKPHPQQTSVMTALQDVLYMAPEWRGRGDGKRFVNWCDTCLNAEGIRAVFHEVRPENNFSPLLTSLGYEKFSEYYVRRF